MELKRKYKIELSSWYGSDCEAIRMLTKKDGDFLEDLFAELNSQTGCGDYEPFIGIEEIEPKAVTKFQNENGQWVIRMEDGEVLKRGLKVKSWNITYTIKRIMPCQDNKYVDVILTPNKKSGEEIAINQRFQIVEEEKQ